MFEAKTRAAIRRPGSLRDSAKMKMVRAAPTTMQIRAMKLLLGFIFLWPGNGFGCGDGILGLLRDVWTGRGLRIGPTHDEAPYLLVASKESATVASLFTVIAEWLERFAAR